MHDTIQARQAYYMIDPVMSSLNSECTPHVVLSMQQAVVM